MRKNQAISHFTRKKLGHSQITKIPFTTLLIEGSVLTHSTMQDRSMSCACVTGQSPSQGGWSEQFLATGTVFELSASMFLQIRSDVYVCKVLTVEKRK